MCLEGVIKRGEKTQGVGGGEGGQAHSLQKHVALHSPCLGTIQQTCTIIGNILNNRCVMRACAEQALRNMMDMYIYFLFMYVSQSNLVLPVSLSGLITLA